MDQSQPNVLHHAADRGRLAIIHNLSILLLQFTPGFLWNRWTPPGDEGQLYKIVRFALS
jgi:hypothetical protein